MQALIASAIVGMVALFTLVTTDVFDRVVADATPEMSVEFYQQDSARVIARWRQPCDVRGCADSYRVQWAVGPQSAIGLRTLTRTIDTLVIRRPAFGDSTVVSLTVTSVRRTLTSEPRGARLTVRTPDAAPPPVDSLRTDTLANIPSAVDSVRLAFFESPGVPLSSPIIPVGDSILAVLNYHIAPGGQRKPSEVTTFNTANLPPSAVVRIRTFGEPFADSAWIALDACACTEGREAAWDLSRNTMVVRSASGLRPVTPQSADPFRAAPVSSGM